MKLLRRKLSHKRKGSWICIAAPHCEKLASEALTHGSHSFYAATTISASDSFSTMALYKSIYLLTYLLYTTPYTLPLNAFTRRRIPPIVITAVRLQLNAFIDPELLSWPCWLAYSRVYPYKWLPISCRSGAVQ